MEVKHKNEAHLIGAVTKDVEVIRKDGKDWVLAKVSLITEVEITLKTGNVVTNKAYHNIVAWGKEAEYIEKKVKKGSTIEVKGVIGVNVWEKKDGTKAYITQITISEIKLLEAASSKGNDDLPSVEDFDNLPNGNSSDDDDDSLPF